MYPKEGLTYTEAMAFWNCTRKEAIIKLNGIIIERHLVNGGTRNGESFWIEDETETFLYETRGTFGTKIEKTCPCGKKFMSNNTNHIYCTSRCNSEAAWNRRKKISKPYKRRESPAKHGANEPV